MAKLKTKEQQLSVSRKQLTAALREARLTRVIS